MPAPGEGLSALAAAVSDGLSRSFREVDIETDVSNGRLLAYLAAHGEILSRSYQKSRVIIHCRLPQKYLGRIQQQETQVRLRNATPQAVEAEPLPEPTSDDSLPEDPSPDPAFGDVA